MWATRPPGRPKWGRKWRKLQEKCKKYMKLRGKIWGNVCILPAREWKAGYGPAPTPQAVLGHCKIPLIESSSRLSGLGEWKIWLTPINILLIFSSVSKDHRPRENNWSDWSHILINLAKKWRCSDHSPSTYKYNDRSSIWWCATYSIWHHFSLANN